ncbi:MAG: Fur family transcriptional regulator [Armatimonadota bacterium]
MRTLRERGHRVTPQRVAIIREFVGRHDHPSAEEVHRKVAQQFPMMALSTVYNTLRLLTQMGEAVEVSPTMPETRFDPDVRDHCHLTCLSCHRIVDLPMEACTSAGELIAAARDAGFEPVRQVYQVYGYCAACQEGGGAAL